MVLFLSWVFFFKHELIHTQLKIWETSFFCAALSFRSLSCEVNSLGLLGFSVPSPLLRKPGELSLGYTSLHGRLKTLTRQSAGTVLGLTVLVSHVSGITVFCCQMSSVLKNNSFIFLLSFLVVSGGKINLFSVTSC